MIQKTNGVAYEKRTQMLNAFGGASTIRNLDEINRLKIGTEIARQTNKAVAMKKCALRLFETYLIRFGDGGAEKLAKRYDISGDEIWAAAEKAREINAHGAFRMLIQSGHYDEALKLGEDNLWSGNLRLAEYNKWKEETKEAAKKTVERDLRLDRYDDADKAIKKYNLSVEDIREVAEVAFADRIGSGSCYTADYHRDVRNNAKRYGLDDNFIGATAEKKIKAQLQRPQLGILDAEYARAYGLTKYATLIEEIMKIQ